MLWEEVNRVTDLQEATGQNLFTQKGSTGLTFARIVY